LAVFTGGASLGVALAVGALATGLSLLSQALNKPKAEPQRSNTQFVGGQTMSSASQSQNYAFSNVDNVSAQNVPVPIGYGRMRVGSKIIQTSIKAYPTNKNLYSEFSLNDSINRISTGFIS
jgi:predicted phage tail protein